MKPFHICLVFLASIISADCSDYVINTITESGDIELHINVIGDCQTDSAFESYEVKFSTNCSIPLKAIDLCLYYCSIPQSCAEQIEELDSELSRFTFNAYLFNETIAIIADAPTNTDIKTLDEAVVKIKRVGFVAGASLLVFGMITISFLCFHKFLQRFIVRDEVTGSFIPIKSSTQGMF